MVQRVCDALSKLNFGLGDKEIPPWIHSLEQMRISEVNLASFQMITERTTFGEALEIGGVPAGEIPQLLAAVSVFIHIRSFTELLPQSLMNMTMKDDSTDETGCMTMQLAQNLVLLVKVPEYIMVGRNLSLFSRKTVTELEEQRRSLGWFKMAMNDRITICDVSKPSRLILEKYDRGIQSWSVMSAIDSILSRFGDSLWTSLAWVTVGDYQEDRKIFDLRPLNEKCSLKIQAVMRPFCEDHLSARTLYSYARSLAPYSACATSPGIGKVSLPLMRTESTVLMSVLGHIMDSQATMLSTLQDLSSKMGTIGDNQKILLDNQRELMKFIGGQGQSDGYQQSINDGYQQWNSDAASEIQDITTPKHSDSVAVIQAEANIKQLENILNH